MRVRSPDTNVSFDAKSENVQDWLILGNEGISNITFEGGVRVAFIDPTSGRIHDRGYRTNFNTLLRDVSKTEIIYLAPVRLNITGALHD